MLNVKENFSECNGELVYNVNLDPEARFPLIATVIFNVKSGYNSYDCFFVCAKEDSVKFLYGSDDLEVDLSDMPAEIENFIRDKIEQIEKWGETELENYLDIDGIKDELNDWYQAERSERIERCRR
jgi:hypothetical protein